MIELTLLSGLTLIVPIKLCAYEEYEGRVSVYFGGQSFPVKQSIAQIKHLVSNSVVFHEALSVGQGDPSIKDKDA